MDDLWQACLLPSLCVCKQGGAYFMVLSVEADVGAVLWPMRKNGEALWFDMCEALRLAMVPDIEEWMVQSVRPVSPLHQWVAAGSRRSSMATGIALLPEGSPATVLDWHLDRGFAHLPEYILKRLLQMQASDVAPVLLEQAAQQDHPREALSMALAYAMRPDMPEADLMRLMHLRRSLEKPEDMSMLRTLLDNDVLSDMCLRQDFLKIRETVCQNEAACHRFREAASSVKPIAETLRRHVPAQKHKKSRKEANPSQPSASGVVGTPAQAIRSSHGHVGLRCGP